MQLAELNWPVPVWGDNLKKFTYRLILWFKAGFITITLGIRLQHMNLGVGVTNSPQYMISIPGTGCSSRVSICPRKPLRGKTADLAMWSGCLRWLRPQNIYHTPCSAPMSHQVLGTQKYITHGITVTVGHINNTPEFSRCKNRGGTWVGSVWGRKEEHLAQAGSFGIFSERSHTGSEILQVA